MPKLVASTDAPARSIRPSRQALDGWRGSAYALALACVVLGAVLRIVEIHNAPLWIDETFTGAIAGQTDFARFVQFARDDAPTSFLYYLIIHVWQMAFGLSDLSLRVPSVIFSLMAVGLAAWWRIPGMTAMERITWAALLATWPPGIGFADDARCYSLLFLIATGEIILFAKLLDKTSMQNAVLWIIAADLMIAANFDAAYLALVQGLIFLWVRKQAALRVWPAIFLVFPAIIELAWKWPILINFEKIGTAWYPLLNGIGLLQIYVYIVGGFGPNGIIWLLYLPIFLLFLVLIGRLNAYEARSGRGALGWTVIATALGVVAIVGVGFVRPSFTWRYLLTFEPGLLLGVVLLTGKLARSAKVTGQIGLMIIALFASLSWWNAGAPHIDSVVPALNIELASDRLMHENVNSVVFAWDSPTADVMQRGLLRAAGGFFFRRAHYPVAITAIRLAPTRNPNRALLAAAAPKHAAIIWLYDRTIIGTAAKNFPAEISKFDASYTCVDFGHGPVGSLACFERNKRTATPSGNF
jgi:uncharacterized membrane protein